MMRRGGAPRNLELGHSARAACPVRSAGRYQGLEEEGWSGEGRMDGEVEVLSQMAGSLWASVTPRTKWKG